MSDTSNESSFLETTGFLDWQHDDVQRFTEDAVGDVRDPVQKARLIFTAVRDRIWYDPYSTDDDPEHYRASYVATASRAYCIPKAVLLTAAARAAGIPARLGFADVRNHLQTTTLRARMGCPAVSSSAGHEKGAAGLTAGGMGQGRTPAALRMGLPASMPTCATRPG